MVKHLLLAHSLGCVFESRSFYFFYIFYYNKIYIIFKLKYYYLKVIKLYNFTIGLRLFFFLIKQNYNLFTSLLI